MYRGFFLYDYQCLIISKNVESNMAAEGFLGKLQFNGNWTKKGKLVSKEK